MIDLQVSLERIGKRDGKRSEATLVADIRRFLLAAPLGLHADDLQEVLLEAPVEGGRRIDIEAGSTILEVERDLLETGALEQATSQLSGDLHEREHQLGRRFSGLVTDGQLWICVASTGEGIGEVTRMDLAAKQSVELFLVWLDGVLATARDLVPSPHEVELRLGHRSSAHQLDRASLAGLYARHRNNPSVQMKRKRWAGLLTTALGTQFSDDDELFIKHTLLVNSAQIIAHAVVGIDMSDVSPISLLSGATFVEHDITGVVEPDFFDWVVEVPGGEAFIRALARRLARFAWATVEHDVLKVLYESVITSPIRKQLGEHYTPDWLAEKLVVDTIDAPLEQRVLDPSCGSGTFVFHAVRRYLDAATMAGHTLADVLRVTQHVFGMDLHPVAVTLARVTYLLAIGRERLAHPERGPVNVPIYLGDSMQWAGALSQASNRVDVLIGNPPWLAFRHMTKGLQEQFRSMSEIRGLWQGAKVATHQDLSSLFVARSIQLYLRVDGRFAFVVPNAALDRSHYAGFRSGRFDDETEIVHVAFDKPWDLRRLRPHFFPRGSAVVFGRRSKRSKAMLDEAVVWTGRIPKQVGSWAELEAKLEQVIAPLTVFDETKASPYKDFFRQGATFAPRMLFLVERRDPGQLGMPKGRALIRSVRTSLEKRPWRDLPAQEGAIETEFIMPVFLGEHVLPHRLTQPAEGVIPWDLGKKQLLSPHGDSRLDSYKFLCKWWRQADATWNEHRSSERLSLVEQLDYHNKLSGQYPLASIRVIYAASGMHICAARVQSPRALIDSSLYWCRVHSIEEARYLCAILNATCVTALVRPYMSYGKDERHIHKHVWKLPIPLFDASKRAHLKLAEQAAEVEAAIAALELDDDLHFAARRRRVRVFLEDHAVAQQIEAGVAKLLGH